MQGKGQQQPQQQQDDERNLNGNQGSSVGNRDDKPLQQQDFGVNGNGQQGSMNPLAMNASPPINGKQQQTSIISSRDDRNGFGTDGASDQKYQKLDNSPDFGTDDTPEQKFSVNDLPPNRQQKRSHMAAYWQSGQSGQPQQGQQQNFDGQQGQGQLQHGVGQRGLGDEDLQKRPYIQQDSKFPGQQDSNFRGGQGQQGQGQGLSNMNKDGHPDTERQDMNTHGQQPQQQGQQNMNTHGQQPTQQQQDSSVQTQASGSTTQQRFKSNGQPGNLQNANGQQQQQQGLTQQDMSGCGQQQGLNDAASACMAQGNKQQQGSANY
ncbi:hypothetical protein B0H66DRAFT_539291 [Apodospora peruviana]|uniref:Uncharacterized protein n=1 Tax=Apodospora peruviana TaxID=516989 RepID=A0AAE0IPW0_9PEZI|nr:hypothetical protein B0H66DRAFT_539291 [Apodospora peruviana]